MLRTHSIHCSGSQHNKGIIMTKKTIIREYSGTFETAYLDVESITGVCDLRGFLDAISMFCLENNHVFSKIKTFTIKTTDSENILSEKRTWFLNQILKKCLPRKIPVYTENGIGWLYLDAREAIKNIGD